MGMNLPACGDHPLSGRTGWRIYAGVFTPARRFVRRRGTSVPVSWGDVNSLELRGQGYRELRDSSGLSANSSRKRALTAPISPGWRLNLAQFLHQVGEGGRKLKVRDCPDCGAGQTHLSSDAKIADEGRPQGGEGTHKGCPYLHFSAKKPASSRQRRREFAIAHYDVHSSRRYAL